MTIRLASNRDLADVLAIVRDVVVDMRAQGNDQWDESYPNAERFLRDIANQALYVVEQSGAVIGFAVVDQDEPDSYKLLPWRELQSALVIHRFAVATHCRGLGAATRLESFICTLAERRGIHQIKTDTYSTNDAMQVFLTKKSYRKVGEMEYRGKPLPFCCYEKIL